MGLCSLMHSARAWMQQARAHWPEERQRSHWEQARRRSRRGRGRRQSRQELVQRPMSWEPGRQDRLMRHQWRTCQQKQQWPQHLNNSGQLQDQRWCRRLPELRVSRCAPCCVAVLHLRSRVDFVLVGSRARRFSEVGRLCELTEARKRKPHDEFVGQERPWLEQP